MDFKEYQDLAMRTNNDKGLEMNRLHAVTGIVTELGELIDAYKRNIWYSTALDTTNVTEEVGDILWYIALLSYCIKSDALTLEPIPDYFNPSPASALSEDEPIGNEWILVQLLSCSLDAGKLALFVSDEFSSSVPSQGSVEEFHDQIDMHLFTLHTGLREFSALAKVDMEKAAEINISKLKARYPGKFTEEAAINRNTVTERNLLESQVNN
jgi:NTP pyrophosphatase (non-canonical NTP hydrolase)